jgi:DNA-binding beta-propeller fold protein YncE
MFDTSSGLHRARTWALGGFLLILASAAQAAPPIELASGLSAGVGIAHDEVKNHLYFVEFNGGTLKRIKLNPACETAPPCPIETVTTGFTHPEDVEVDGALGVGYVTTRDDVGTTGALWRVDLATGARSLVTFNLGAPHQIALDMPTNTAYVVGFDIGKLWKIDLTTGVKVAVVTGLGHPVGLAITADRTRAYVSEQSSNRVSEYDLALGSRTRDVATGLISPFFLSWTDPAQISLYVAERSAANQITRIDLATATKLPVLTALPVNPSGIALNYTGSALYLTTDSKVLRAELAALPMSEPVFLGVGHVPSTKIVSGYATTDPGYFFQVKHAPFGGTLNLFGNLSNFKMLGATHYRVLVSKDGGPYGALGQSWTAYRWNTTTLQYEAVNVAPVTADQRYAIPPEYPALAARWYPAFLMMRWPSSANGSYSFKVEIYNGAANPTATPLPTGNSLTLAVDNTPPEVDIVAIRQHPGPMIKACDIVTAAPNRFDFQITATDPNQHMLSYDLAAYWGKNKSASITGAADSYASHVSAAPPHAWGGVINAWLPAAGWAASCNCAHTFILRAWKRTTDGYGYVLSGQSSQSLTINNTGVVCP